MKDPSWGPEASRPHGRNAYKLMDCIAPLLTKERGWGEVNGVRSEGDLYDDSINRKRGARTRENLRAAGGGGEVVSALEGARLFPRRAGPDEKALLHHDSAAQHHRQPAHGPRAEQHYSGRDDALASDARLLRPLPARNRSRGHRHADGRGKDSRERGQNAPADRA